ncbi:hypothetical protein JCM10207_005013 [Rhodosporidiobolus poonsookiae]
MNRDTAEEKRRLQRELEELDWIADSDVFPVPSGAQSDCPLLCPAMTSDGRLAVIAGREYREMCRKELEEELRELEEEEDEVGAGVKKHRTATGEAGEGVEGEKE